MTSRHTVAVVGSAVALAAAGLVAVTATGTAAATATAPWTDPQSIGSITFYDTSGTAITSGSITAPFFGYAVGSNAPAGGSSAAAVVVATPKPDTAATPNAAAAAAGWFRDQLSSFTPDPVTGAPAAVASATGPVAQGGAGDLTLADYIAEAPNDATHVSDAAYQNLYEVRLVAADTNGHENSQAYDTAVIQIDPAAKTWSLYSGGSSGGGSADATTLTGGSSSRITYGKQVTESAVLTDSTTGSPASGQKVALFAKPRNAASYRQVATATSGSTGRVSTVVRPSATTSYQWRFAGTGTLKAATGPTRTVTVVQRVSIAAKPAKARPRATVRLYGTVTPSVVGEKVALQHKVGTKYRTVATARLKRQKLPNGRTTVGWVVAVKAPAKGRAVYRAVSSATAATSAGTSGTVTVTG